MPYRRLPNTDATRVKALHTAISRGDLDSFTSPVISFKSLNDAKAFIVQFEKALSEYKAALTKQSASNKDYQSTMRMARLYVSHFIQVLGMCVLRKEINADKKELYHLDPESSTVPDLSSEAALLEWGNNVISGERARTSKGGMPIYNPTIAKVQVYVDIFKEAYNNQKVLQHNTVRALKALSNLRGQGDSIILDIWNQVEAHYADLPLSEKVAKCQEYGLRYYYRRGEENKEKLELIEEEVAD